jgi:hypothetical protein
MAKFSPKRKATAKKPAKKKGGGKGTGNAWRNYTVSNRPLPP